MRRRWDKTAWKDYQAWKRTNPQIAERINDLLKDIQHDPFNGIGHPEPLKWDLAGYWSRRIDKEHRLIYGVAGDILFIYSCRGHYK